MSINLPGYDDYRRFRGFRGLFASLGDLFGVIAGCFHDDWFISYKLGDARGRSHGHCYYT
jgi:hypothetical protein